MTKRTAFLTRCLALVLALVLVVANVNLGVALRAFAADGEGAALAETGSKRVTDLYSVIGDNSGDPVIEAILASGALKGNVAIEVTEPTDALLSLKDGELKAEDLASGFAGLSWKPYSYGAAAGDNLFTGNTATWTSMEAKVSYRLTLEGYNADEVIALAKTLKADADEQAAALNRLAGHKQSMLDLNGNILKAVLMMLPMIDLNPDDGIPVNPEAMQDPTKMDDLQKYFHEILSDIVNNNMSGNNLVVCGIIDEYLAGGMTYYYQNAEYVRSEVMALSANLNGLAGDPEKEAALAILLGEFGAAEYIGKISKLGEAMAQIESGLSMPNEAIDLNSANLPKLLTALADTRAVNPASVAVPYLTSVDLVALDTSAVNVQATVNVSGKNIAVSTPSFSKVEVVTQDVIDGLQADITAAFESVIPAENRAYYAVTVDTDLAALVGKTLDTNVYVNVTYKPVEYNVYMNGELYDTVTVEDLWVTLPKHDRYPTLAYDYTVMGETVTVRAANVQYKFPTLEGFDGNITRTENNKVLTDFEAAFESDIIDLVYDAEGNVTGMIANVDPSQGGVMAFATEFLTAGYGYIALNGETLMDESSEITLQALVNALLNDNGFGSARLSAMADGETNTLLNTKITIRATEDEPLFEDIDFTLNLTSIPEKMVTVGNGLEAVKDYMSFKSNNGIMDVKLNLPDPVYEAYLTALLATSNLEKSDINAMNQAIAFNFLDDYLEMVMAETAISADTYENTLNMMIREFNEAADKEVDYVELSQYDAYYSVLERALNGETVELNANPDDYTIDISAKGEDVLEFVDILGIDISSYEVYTSMVKELKQGGVVKMTIVAVLDDANNDFEAAVIDLAKRSTKRETVEKVFDYAENLPARVAELKGESVIVLLDDVNGNLTFNKAAVLDLNGKTINGSIHTNSKLFIIDSSLNTVSGGGVTGAISGDVTILAGTYASDVSAFLKDGYVQKDGAVQNAMYYYNNGNVVINTNFMFDDAVEGYLPAVHYMATEIAIDMILSYYTAASLTIEGNDIYAISFDDLVGMLGSDAHSGKVANLVDDLLGMIRFDGDVEGNGGIDNLANMIIADLLDLESISAAIKNGTKLGDYTITTRAWSVGVKYVADGDYMTFGVVPNPEITNSITLSLTFSGSNKDKVVGAIDELARIIDDETYFTIDLDQPYRDGKTLVLSGGFEGLLSLDFSHNDAYIRMLSTLLAYGNPELYGDVANASVDELIEAIDATTVGDFFNALKVVAEKTGYKVIDRIEGETGVDVEAVIEKVPFKKIAEAVGVELTDSQLAKLETAYDIFMTNICKVLNKMDGLTEIDVPMSRWKLEDGTYYIDGDIQAHNADAYYRGYGVDVTLEGVFVGLKIKLAETCLWGDANHDGVVDPYDATLVLQYYIDSLADGQFFCTRRTDVNGDGVIDPMDATLILQYYVGTITKFPAEG